MNNHQTPLVVDTHIWLWLINADPVLEAPRFQKAIQPFIKNSELWVSVISVWEVGMLKAKGRLNLPYDVGEWCAHAVRAPGILLAPLTPEIAVESTRLPGTLHGDPSDRILIATSKIAGGTFITRDKKIITYCQTYHLPVAEF